MKAFLQMDQVNNFIFQTFLKMKYKMTRQPQKI